MQVERGSELTFASDKLRDASSHCSTVVRGLWIVAVLHAVLMGGYIWSGVSGRAVPLQDLGIALYDDYFGLGVIVVTLLSLSFSAGVAVWWLRWQCAIGRAAGHMGFMMRGWWNLLAWVIPGVNVVAPLVLVGRMARSMRANLPLLFLGAWWLLWLGLSWRQVQLIVEPRGEWTSEQAYFTALAMFLWLILDFTAMRVAMGLTVAGWRSLEKVSAERGATATEINVAVAGAREFSPVQNVSWSGAVRGRGSAIGRRVASGSKSALAAASAGTVKAARKSKSFMESAAAARRSNASNVTNAEPPNKEGIVASAGRSESAMPVDLGDDVDVLAEELTGKQDNVVDVSDTTLQKASTDEAPDHGEGETEPVSEESSDAEEQAVDSETDVVDVRDGLVDDLHLEQDVDNDDNDDNEDGEDDVDVVFDDVSLEPGENDSDEDNRLVASDTAESSQEHPTGSEAECANDDEATDIQEVAVPEARKSLDNVEAESVSECTDTAEAGDGDVQEEAAAASAVVRHSPRNAGSSGAGRPAAHDVDEAIDGLVTRLSSVAEAANDKS